MEPDIFNATQPVIDKIHEIVEKQLDSDELRSLITELGKVVGNGLVASIDFIVQVYDEKRECKLPLLTTGLSSVPEKEPYLTSGDSTPQKYVIADGIRMVPNDRCPKCWQEWDFKLNHPTCPHCGLTMGATCKLLLDTDECPWCNEGKVTVANPKCDECGYEVDPLKVVWG